VARCPTCHRRLVSGQSCPQHAGAAAPHADPITVGAPPPWSRALGRCLGSGGFAAVWEVVDDPNLVLKVAHADHDLARARLAREAEALAAVGPPAVPRIASDGVLADGRAWIAMERIDGANLGELVAQGPIRTDRVIAMARSLARALVRVHAGGFIHRDLKPDNIYRRRDGSIVILDLGLARRHPDDPDDPTRAGVQVGSLEYMPPEQLLDAASVDPRADIYAFGCVLYELCAGRPPFVGDASALERAHAALRPPPLGALAQVPSGLEELCHDCLAKQPARRPGSAGELVARMDAIHEEVSAVQPQHSRSVISEGNQPVVLVFAELPKVDRAILGMLAARKITVVSQRGRRVLGGVLGADHADPASAAIAAARDLAGAGARVALHLDALHVTARGGATVLVGAAVERPEDWLPSVAWTGVVLTRALATVTQLPTRPTSAGPGFVMLGEAGDTAELVGRDAILSDLVADALAAFDGAGPALATLIGDHGIGKSALAAALLPRLRELAPTVHFGTIPPPGSGRPAHAALAELIGTPAGPIVRAVGDALRDAARRAPTAIILDDIHLAEHEFLDALEYATLGGEPLPLWILCLAAPRLDQRRPGFGSRAERRNRATLPPLDEDAAVAMTAMLLRPAEYPPLRALRQIATIARGNPMHLATIAREIRDRGAIRTRPNGEHFLDTTALDALPPVALGPWLAARELAPLGVELVSLARVCAVLGDELDRTELAAVLEAVERRGGATTTIDVDVGLAELEAHGILVPTSTGFAFRQALLHEGVYTTTNEDERRVLHAAALEYWRTRPAGDAERIARHAEAVGDRAAAAEAFARLGEQAHRDHHLLDADQGWTGALRNLDERSRARTDALLGRARARARQQRLGDALADLEDAIANARELGDPRQELVALLEKATTLDLADDFTASKEVAIVARARFAQLPDPPPELALDLELAEARVAFRARKFADAAQALTRVASAARVLAREDALTTAQLLLAPALVEAGEPTQARAVFADLIERCDQRGDRFHLGAAYGNRAWLWSALGEVDRTAEDLRLVIQLAREVGHAMLERAATYNLAEDRFWQGAVDEATQLARRSIALQQSHGESATRFDRLLLARILAARLERPELAELLAKLATEESSDDERVVLATLQAVASDADAATWESVLASVDVLDPAQRLELSHLAARAGHLTGARRTEILALVNVDPIWSRRIGEF
jgi:tetratricopeptide (TPR) repeat protein